MHADCRGNRHDVLESTICHFLKHIYLMSTLHRERKSIWRVDESNESFDRHWNKSDRRLYSIRVKSKFCIIIIKIQCDWLRDDCYCTNAAVLLWFSDVNPAWRSTEIERISLYFNIILWNSMLEHRGDVPFEIVNRGR